MYKLILGGISAGLLMTLMTGPAFFSLIRTSIQKGFFAGASFAMGVFFADTIFVVTTFLGASLISLAESNQKFIAVIGGAFLIVIGYRYLIKKPDINAEAESTTSKLKHTGYFLKGLLMNLLNPGMLFYWIGLVSYLGTNADYTNYDIKVFIFCSMFTVLSTDLGKAYFASKVRHLFSEKVVLWMNRLVGSALIVFAVVMMVKVFLF
ncbi:MAG: LysE family translocator [bacterium]|jgi:threonine/homoserine/homoserine lactone efflux protein